MPPEPGFPSAGAIRIPVDVRRFPWIRKLAADYAYDFPAVSPFFAGDPAAPQSWSETIGRVQAHARPRADLAALLIAQQRRRSAPLEALNATGQLRDPRTVAVVTGQQAGLFGGPLFTLLKALTALKLSARVAQEHGVPVVTVFWIDAEDHDWDEVCGCSILNSEFQRQTITLPSPANAGQTPVAAVKLTEAINQALDELSGALPRTEFSDSLLEELRVAYRPGVGMVDAFGRWMEAVLGRFGLIVYDGADPAAKPLAATVFAREVEHPGRTSQLALEAGARLVALGYHAQVARQDSAALFRLDGTRQAIRPQGDRFAIGEAIVDVTALKSAVLANPADFSPNVLLRPIVQDALFPTIAYVSGPNELAYLAQLRPVYEHFGVPMPLLYPRASVTVLDSAVSRFLAKYDLPLESLQPRDEAALNRLLAALLPESVERSMQEALRAVDESMASLIAAVPEIDRTLEGAAKSTLGKMQHDLKTLQGKIISAAKRRDDTLRRQFGRAQAQAFPDGQPQERAIGFVSFLNRYGPAFVDRLADELPLDLGHHWIVTL